MKNWPDKLRLLTILATTKVLLSRSGSEGWGLEYPKEAEQQIDRSVQFKQRIKETL
jgi:hypothetical protein